MDGAVINSTISSNIIAPSVVIAAFSLFFITYSHGAFNKFRKPEFGVLLVLGMTNKDIRKVMLLENSVIAAASLLAGLLSGTVFSRLVYFVINNVIGIKNVSFELTLNSYLYTIGLFAAIYILVLAASLVKLLGYEIINLLKGLRIEERGISIGPWFGLLGLILMICSAVYMQLSSSSPSLSILISMLMCFTGAYLLLSNLVWFLKLLGRFSKRLYTKNLLFVTNIKYTFGKSKNVLFIITCLIAISILYTSLGIIYASDAERLATGYNPYHIAYAEVYDMNVLPEKELHSIMTSGETPLILRKDLEFIKHGQVSILSEEQLNKVLGCNFHVKEKSFISLLQLMKDDGYSHDTTPIKTFNLRLNNKSYTYSCQEQYEKILFNKLLMLNNDFILVLNNSNYLQVKNEVKAGQVGYIRLFNFEDWKKTGSIVNRLNSKLEDCNKIHDRVFKPASRIEVYTEYNQSSSFLLFLLFFVSIIFFFASNVMLHFKLLAEFQREKLKYKKIYKLGITKKEAAVIISKELRIVFFLPVIFGVVIAIIFSSGINLYGKGVSAIESSLAIGSAYLLFQALTYLAYKKYYINKLFDF
jgi:putative ABC transport system permease protein